MMVLFRSIESRFESLMLVVFFFPLQGVWCEEGRFQKLKEVQRAQRKKISECSLTRNERVKVEKK